MRPENYPLPGAALRRRIDDRCKDVGHPRPVLSWEVAMMKNKLAQFVHRVHMVFNWDTMWR